MDIREWIGKYEDLIVTKIVVEEIVGTAPLTQYSVIIDGTVDGIVVVITYTTTWEENDRDLSDSTSRMLRYGDLLSRASTETDINTEVKDQIDVLVGTP